MFDSASEPQQRWDHYIRPSFVPTEPEQCLRLAEEARRSARSYTNQAIRSRCGRIADDYVWLATRGRSEEQIRALQLAHMKRVLVRLVIARLKMMAYTVPGSAIAGAGIEVARFFLTGKP